MFLLWHVCQHHQRTACRAGCTHWLDLSTAFYYSPLMLLTFSLSLSCDCGCWLGTMERRSLNVFPFMDRIPFLQRHAASLWRPDATVWTSLTCADGLLIMFYKHDSDCDRWLEWFPICIHAYKTTVWPWTEQKLFMSQIQPVSREGIIPKEMKCWEGNKITWKWFGCLCTENK